MVPGDYSTIQAAMDAASALTVDTVLVSIGTYNEVISFRGKDVRVISTWGPAYTTIKGPMLADRCLLPPAAKHRPRSSPASRSLARWRPTARALL